MTLYQQLKATGNPLAPAQTIVSLSQNYKPKIIAEILGVSVRWVYKVIQRYKESGQKLDACVRKKGPKNPMPNRTPSHVEGVVAEMAKSTNLGPLRLSAVLSKYCGVNLSPYTIRNILRRSGIRCRKVKTRNSQRRYWVDMSAFKPLQFWQIDVKHIADQHALPAEAYAAIFRHKLPRYQFTAIDAVTRLRLIAYAHELNFANGLAFLAFTAHWLRAFGIKDPLFFQTDNGEEFGGAATSRKRNLMQKFIFDSLNVTLLNIPPREKQFNTFVERSHRTDDEEFYAVNLSRATSRSLFMQMAQDWIFYYNYQRPHFGRGMKGRTPFEVLRDFRTGVSPAIGAMPVVLLDRLSLYLDDCLCKVSSIPWDRSPKNLKLVNETMAYYHIGLYELIQRNEVTL